MRSVVSRLARLERLNQLSTVGGRLRGLGAKPQRLRIQYGDLKTLPDGYPGPRHTVTVTQLPPGPGGEDRFGWEERPGPEPDSNATGPNDEILIQVSYVEAKTPA